MEISPLKKIGLMPALLGLLLASSFHVQAFDWMSDGYTLKTGDYNGDGIEDLFVVRDQLMVPIMMDITVVIPVEQDQYVFLGDANGSFTREIITAGEIANLSLTEIHGSLITLSDVDFDGQQDITIESGTGANTVVLYGGNQDHPEIAYEIDSGENQAVGMFSGDFSVTKLGTASYTIPIDVPNIGLGTEPQLAFVYNSNTANGELGMGWSLSGVRSSISRCPKTLLHDGVYAPVEFNEDDQFCVEGQRLIATGNNEYRTKSFSNMRVVAHSVDASKGPLYFTVHTADGIVTKYGGSDATSNSLSSDGKRFIWHRVSVGFEGQSDAKTNYFIESVLNPTISYGGIDITFSYEDRPDSGTATNYGHGSPIALKSDKRLSHISIRKGRDILSSYKLNYETVGVINKSRISSITKKAADGRDYPPIIFQYTSDSGSSTGFSTAKSDNHTDPKSTLLQGDFDGDGFSDILYVKNVNQTLDIVNFEGGADDGPLKRSTVSHPTALIDGVFGTQGKTRFLSGDFNRDGVSDILAFTRIHGVEIIESKGNGSLDFKTVVSGYKPWDSYGLDYFSDILVGDFNGDGRSDLMHIVNDDTVHVWLRTNSNFSVHTYDPNISISGSKLVTGDFNGDGLLDFALGGKYGVSKFLEHEYQDNLTIFFSKGDGTFRHYTSIPKAGRPLTFDPTVDNGGIFSAADFNGDGRTDILHGPANEKPAVLFGRGDGNFDVREQMFGNYNAGSNNDQMWLVDVNADGLDDVVHAPSDDGFRILLSPGMGTDAGNQLTFVQKGWVPMAIRQALQVDKGLMFGDYNRDGAIDLSFWSGQMLANLWINTTLNTFYSEKDYSRTISSIKIGRKGSLRTDVSYGRPPAFNMSTRTGVWGAPLALSPSAVDALAGAREIEPAWPVVTATETTYSLNGGTNRVEYEYGDLRVHVNGGGLLGYDKVKRKNIAANTEVRTSYNFNVKDFQHGQVDEEIVYDKSVSPFRTISQSRTYYETRRIGEFYSFYPASQTSAGFGNNGITFNAVDTTQTLVNNTFRPATITTCQKSSIDSNTCLNTTVQSLSYHGASSLPGFEPEVSQKVTTTTVNYGALGMTVPANGKTSATQTERYTYERGLLKTKTISPGTADEITQTFVYDFNIRKPTSVTTKGPQFAQRTSTTSYDNQGRVTGKTNPLGHSVSIHYDDALYSWLPTRQVDANGLTQTTTYDDLGRVSRVTNPDGTFVDYQWDWDWERDSQGRGIRKSTFPSVGAPSLTFLDFLGREYRTETYGYRDGQLHEVVSSTEYDRLGRVTKQHAANYSDVGDYAPVEHLYYDSLSRITRRHVPAAGVDYGFEYAANQKVTRLNGSVDKTETYWANGKVKDSIVGPTGTPGITMHYDPSGNLSRSVDPNGNQVVMHYDDMGRKVRMDDPDKGTWTYTYYPDGTLKSQTDAKNQRTEMSYDILGRMTLRIDRNNAGAEVGRSSWVYDSAANGKGKLHRETSNNGFERIFHYDGLGRTERTETKIDGTSYQISTTYDGQGRVNTITHPTGFVTRNQYDHLIGVPTAIANASNGQVLKEFKSYTASGQLEAYRLGQLINGSSYFDPNQAGRVTSVQAWIVGPSLVDQTYSWDVRGNLQFRQDHTEGWREDFSYDGLDRLKAVNTSGTATSGNTTIRYDALGNITFKSDVGDYRYTGGKPHAVTQAGGWSIVYDANGNMVTKDGSNLARQTLAYTVFNKPSSISSADGKVSRFWYGPNRSRFKRQDTTAGQNTTVHYVGGYEKTMGPTGTVERLYVGGNVIVLKENGNQTLNYLIKDHLGSIIAIFNQDGSIKERLSYDPWGKRRAPNTIAPINVFDITLAQLTTTRGYTGHEHIDGMGLIHMNGRVYDPTIARFLSADPHIQAPGNLQSYNRYSYVMNNPLRYTDPSGYFWKKIKRGLSSFWKKNRRGFFKAMFGIVGYNSSTVRNIITGGACIMVPASCGAVTAANAYASGASTSDALKAGARGQIGAAIGQGVAGYAGGAHAAGTWQNIVGNGIGGGVQSRINGGSFRDGFVGGAFGAAFKPAGFKLFPYANQGLQRVITAGLVGGTGSYLSGGKFGYGAFSGAFGQYWNGERHVTYVGEDGKTYRVKVWQSAEGMMAEAAGAESIDAYNTTTRSEVATGLGIVSLMTTPYAWITGTAAVGAYVLSPSESNAFGVATIPLGAGARWLDEGLYYGQKGIEGVVENAGIINGIGGAADAMVPDELRSH